LFRRRLDNSNISGLYVSHPSAGDCVLINYSEDIYRQRFTAAHEAAHAFFDREEEVVVSFWDTNDLKEIRANTFASRYLMPPEFLRKIPNARSWDREKVLKWAQDMRVNPHPLVLALSAEGLITQEQAQELDDVKISRDVKRDPELPDSLAPRSRERKLMMLERGLSDAYVSLCFKAYRDNSITAPRLVELLLLDGDEELRELATLYRQELEYGT
jgi:Zn-dependent peptidase ImmA (M78 family)